MKITSAKILLNKNGLVQKIIGTDLWTVQESFIWYLDYKDKKYKIEVPNGFKTNFGSIPWFARMFMDKTKYVGYVLHDYTWSKDSKIIDTETGQDFEIGFKQSNEILEECMQVEGSSKIERTLVYIGLQYTIFPYFHFKDCKEL